MATWLIVVLAVVAYLLAGGAILGLLSPELPDEEAGCTVVFIIVLWPLGLAISIGVWVRGLLFGR